jgi:hypothetical protein
MEHLSGKNCSMFSLVAHFLQIQFGCVHLFMGVHGYPDSIGLIHNQQMI